MVIDSHSLLIPTPTPTFTPGTTATNYLQASLSLIPPALGSEAVWGPRNERLTSEGWMGVLLRVYRGWRTKWWGSCQGCLCIT